MTFHNSRCCDQNCNPTTKQPGSDTVYVVNLYFSVDEETLCGVLKDCGMIVALQFREDIETKAFIGYAFMGFEETEVIDKIVAMSGTEIMVLSSELLCQQQWLQYDN
eukprot:7363943-Ditylum_brightwellii.AAC.1